MGHGLQCALRIGHAADHEDGHGARAHDGLDGLQPAHDGHFQVHGHEARAQGLHHLHRLAAVAGFAHHLDAGLGLQQATQQPTGEAAVVGDEHADVRHRLHCSVVHGAARHLLRKGRRAALAASPAYCTKGVAWEGARDATQGVFHFNPAWCRRRHSA